MKCKNKLIKNGLFSTMKAVGLLMYFVIAQVIITLIVLGIKIQTDMEWLYEINECLTTYGALSTEYFSLIMELLVPITMLADIVIVLPIIINAIVKKKAIYKILPIKDILKYIVLGVFLNIGISFVVTLLPESVTTTNYNAMMNQIMLGSFSITFLSAGIVAPIVEELLFRYCICNWYKNEKIAIFMSALLFGIAHMNPIQSTYAFILGLMLAYLYIKRKNLLIPTIIHLAINSSSVIFEYLM